MPEYGTPRGRGLASPSGITYNHSMLSRARVTQVQDRSATLLPNPHDARWGGISKIPAAWGFEREDYIEWHRRGMLPRDACLVWLTWPGCYVLLMKPPKVVRAVEVDTPAGKVEEPEPSEEE